MKKLPILPIATVALGLVCAFVVMQRFKALEQKQEIPLRGYLIATRGIAPGELGSLKAALKAGYFAPIAVPIAAATNLVDAIPGDEMRVWLERQVQVPVRRGEILGRRHFADIRRKLAAELRDGRLELITMSVSTEGSVGHNIKAGDRVTVWGVPAGTNGARGQGFEVLETGMLVVGIGLDLALGGEIAVDDRGRRYRHITLAANRDQIRMLKEAKGRGQISFSLPLEQPDDASR